MNSLHLSVELFLGPRRQPAWVPPSFCRGLPTLLTSADLGSALSSAQGAEDCGCSGGIDKVFGVLISWGNNGYRDMLGQGTSNEKDCMPSACRAGCEIARRVHGFSFYGRDLVIDEVEPRVAKKNSREMLLVAALANLTAHVAEASVTDILSQVDLAAAAETVMAHGDLLKTKTALVTPVRVHITSLGPRLTLLTLGLASARPTSSTPAHALSVHTAGSRPGRCIREQPTPRPALLQRRWHRSVLPSTQPERRRLQSVDDGAEHASRTTPCR